MNTRIGTKINEDYTITQVMESSNELGIAVGYQEFNGKKYWATWEYIPARENDYFWGHYMIPTEEEALKDALERIGWATQEPEPEENETPETELIGSYEDSLKKRRRELWDDLNEGVISEEEWELQMWADGFLPADHFSDDDNPQF